VFANVSILPVPRQVLWRVLDALGCFRSCIYNPRKRLEDESTDALCSTEEEAWQSAFLSTLDGLGEEAGETVFKSIGNTLGAVGESADDVLTAVVLDAEPLLGKLLVVVDQQRDAVAEGTGQRLDRVEGALEGIADEGLSPAVNTLATLQRTRFEALGR
jgi:hypothetical protein